MESFPPPLPEAHDLEESETVSSHSEQPKPWGCGAMVGLAVAVGVVFLILQSVVVGIFMLLAKARTPGASMIEIAENIGSNGDCLTVATVLSSSICTVMILAFLSFRKTCPVGERLAFRNPARRMWILSFVALGVYMASYEGLGVLLGRDTVPDSMVEVYRTSSALPLLYLAVIVFAPISEEICFRGFLLGEIKRSRLGSVGAVFITSGLWAIMHSDYDAYYIVDVFVFGLLLGYVRLRTESTYTTVALHVVNNLLSMIQIAMQVNALR